jgi:hypothetical protein
VLLSADVRQVEDYFVWLRRLRGKFTAVCGLRQGQAQDRNKHDRYIFHAWQVLS